MKIVAIIQARMGSTRLPGKMMMDIAGKPAIENVWDRVRLSKHLDEIWLATSVDSQDDVLAQWAEDKSVLCYRGSENDVLDRFYQVAVKSHTDVVVRLTGDCPLHDSNTIDKVIDLYGDGTRYDYVSNVVPPTYPDGLDVEVFSFDVLADAWHNARLKSEREHVTPYIRSHAKPARIGNLLNDVDLSMYRWTLDTKEDLKLIRLIASECLDKERCGKKRIYPLKKGIVLRDVIWDQRVIRAQRRTL